MDLESLILRPLTRDELDIAVEWAAFEGWNPGLHDADVFWSTDPDGFVGAEMDGELIATGSIVSYNGQYGFMGFFLVHPDLRGKGIGTKLWFYRRDLLRSRLKEGAVIAMDGVFEMQDWYAKGGFEFTHRNLRMEGVGRVSPDHSSVLPLERFSREQVEALDTSIFGCSREAFLDGWLCLPDSLALGYESKGELSGYGVIRACREGYKVGPLFAGDPDVAESIFSQLSASVEGEALWVDVPENNPDAVELARRLGMKEVFGCARMYSGGIPEVPWEKIYGITTFELG